MKPPKIVFTMDKLQLGRSVAATSELRDWDVRLAHGMDRKDAKGLLHGRAFFSSQQGYPFAVFSLVRYEPKKEEAARRRRKVEELGGGRFQFVMSARDWKGKKNSTHRFPNSFLEEGNSYDFLILLSIIIRCLVCCLHEEAS